MIKAVLFDMDGVLYDSMPNHVQAWSETMTAVGTNHSSEDFYLLEGRTGYSTIDILFRNAFGRDASQEEKESIYARKANRFMELNVSPIPMAGAVDVLKKVKELGLKRIIVTGSGQQSLFENLEQFFPGYFNEELMVTAYDVKYGKPHPEPYLLGLKKAGLNPDEAIVVENAPLGIESAKAAGIYTVAVNTGPLDDKILLDAGANVIFSSMKVLAENMETIIRSIK